MKVIPALFLDDLPSELDACGTNKRKLERFQSKLSSLKFLDPACGCGNFLVVAYREIRKLELEILRQLHSGKSDKRRLFSASLLKIDVDQMYGIEIEEWPARIAEVAMWLIDHQMNILASEAFGLPIMRLPLEKSAKIYHGNALRVDWNRILPADECSYVLGNPPFVGARFQTPEQRKDMEIVCAGIKNSGALDYVCAWYFVAAKYIHGTKVRCSFVSTNSISQGEQVGTLWTELLRQEVTIGFAFRTFNWTSEARGKAHVHVVIIGFGNCDFAEKKIYEVADLSDSPMALKTKNISPYLLPGPNVVVTRTHRPLCDVPEIGVGNKPIDGGNYLFTREEKRAFVKAEPQSKKYFKKFFGAQDFIHNEPRWCLWLGDTPPSELRSMPLVMERIKAVQQFRRESKSAPTRAIADTPTRFHVERIPTQSYLLIPRVSSERRPYIPMGYMRKSALAGDSCLVFPDASLFQFGVLTSEMHMVWVRHICGRLKSDYRYSAKLVYNNFPWPTNVTKVKEAKVTEAAKQVLETRKAFKSQSFADLYDPLTMPKELRDAHKKLDRIVDRVYRPRAFQSERSRMEFLFGRYQTLTQPLLPKAEKKSRKTRR